MSAGDTEKEPGEHVRFARYLDELERVTEADEADLTGRILTDPDPTMARSAVLRHVDRRGAELCLGPAWEEWVETMTAAVLRHPLLTRRLREWALFRAVTLRLPWRREDLIASSDWLQLKAAAGPSPEGRRVLAEHGRTKRIRHTARTGPAPHGEH
ncbi:hypothetical protein ACFU3E_00850 [Streptomyces sp. NPDC057424]|uniref:hypothetical protein n=1 Tax=Streptomyces sp. NPDC057424 TaxID=3346127 RepID=UPI0036CF4918